MKANRGAFALLITATLIASACGSDDGDDAQSSVPVSAQTTDPATETSAPLPQESAPTQDQSNSFDSALPPVLIGFHNLEGGSFSIPETRDLFEAGVEYVNSELGGINGHELQVEYCDLDTTPESSINCANQFVERGVVASVQGYDVAIDAALPVFREAGILEIAPQPLGAAINAAVGDALIMGPSSQGGIAIGSLLLANKQGAKKIAFLLPDLPSSRAVYDDTIAPLAEELGYDVEAYYYSQPADWTTFAPTALTGGADWINMSGVDADYLAAIPAFRNAGFTGTFNANVFTQISDLAPAMLEDVIVSSPYYTETMVSGVPPEAQADIDVYERYLGTVSGIERATPARAGFFMAVQAADVLRQVDDPTSAAAVLEQGVQAKGHVFFTDLTYDCAKPSWPGTTSCTGINIWSSINANGELEVLPDQPVDLSAVTPED